MRQRESSGDRYGVVQHAAITAAEISSSRPDTPRSSHGMRGIELPGGSIFALRTLVRFASELYALEFKYSRGGGWKGGG